MGGGLHHQPKKSFNILLKKTNKKTAGDCRTWPVVAGHPQGRGREQETKEAQGDTRREDLVRVEEGGTCRNTAAACLVQHFTSALVCWHDKRQHSIDSRKKILRGVGQLPSHVYILPPSLPSPPHQSLGVCLTERTGPCVNCARDVATHNQPNLFYKTGVSSKFANSVQTFVGLYSR